MLINQLTNLCLNILCKQAALVVLLFLFTGCILKPKIEVDLRKPINDPALTVTINQAITENVGTCSFTASSDPTYMAGFEYRIQFSKAIDPSSLTTADITNTGTGGGTTLTWSLANCGDDTNFKLTASSIVGYGSIIPNLVLNTVQNLVGNNNSASTSTDNSVDFMELGWAQEAYIKAANSEANDYFGNSVALRGDTLAVGAYLEDSNQAAITNGTTASADNSSSDSGAVYVYKRTGVSWAQEAYIKAANNEAGDKFGYCVALSGDTLAVGAYQEDSNQTTITNGTMASADNSSLASGAVYVYRRTGVSWAQEAYIKAANNGASDTFGQSVTLSGETLAVGSYLEDSNQTTITNGTIASADNSSSASGAVYVYKRTGVSWAQEAYIKAANGEANDYFGYGVVALSADTLAVGAYQEDSNQNTITNGTIASADNSSADSGAVYVYKRTGVSWAQEAYIKAVNNEADDRFGSSVTLSGEILAVGASQEDSNQTTITNGTIASADNSSLASGAVYVYKRTGVSWAQEAYIKAANGESSDRFGSSVTLSGDTLAVGAYQEDSNQSTISNGTMASADNSSADSGAVYVYKRTGVSWAQEAYIKAANNGASDTFGKSITLSGDTLAVGVRDEDSNQTTITNGTTASADNSSFASGAVYIYRNSTRLFDVSEVWATATSTTMTFTWQKSGGTAIGYYYAYQVGATAPADCTSGIYLDVGDVTTATIAGLTASSTYSYRVCSSSDGSTFSTGVTGTITTSP